MPIDAEQWRAHTGLFCASRMLLQPPRRKQPKPKVQAYTLSLNMKFSLAVLLVTLRIGVFYASQALQLLWLIACHASWLLLSTVRTSCKRLRGVSVLLALCLVVVPMLLIMSGDVEENPGPIKIQATSLGPNDLIDVRKELLDVSSKWYDIGLELRLRTGCLENIECQNQDVLICLRKMLLHWLKKVDPPPTWERLACALETCTVGEPRLAEQLRTKYCKTPQAAGRPRLQTVATKDKGPPSVSSRRVHRSLPTASRSSYIPQPVTRKGVPAGDSVGQRPQTMSIKERPHSRCDSVFLPSHTLPSTTSKLSHIPHQIARRGVDPVEQQWQLHEARGEIAAPRSPIYGPVPHSPAHTAVDQYASYLRSVYTSKKLPTYCKWPPTASKKYIHLAVVKKEKVSKQQADEFTKATLHGNVDDICKMKQEVGFREVGKKEDGTLAKLILVEGAPGIGKTTFAWKVCRKWAKGKILKEYGLVVLLRLRDNRVQMVKCVDDLFYHSDHELQKSVAKEIQYHQGKSVLLLYEGYDELPKRQRIQQSIFLDILRKDSIPHATILITSRQSATKYLHWEFREQISQHIEILGFTKDDIMSYVHHVVQDKHVCQDFLQYLKCYPYIRGMMYVPLNAVIVTEVYKTSQHSPDKFIPTTMTELYTALTHSLLLRYLFSHSEYQQQEWNLKNFSDLPKELHEQFCRICEVAFKGMIEDEFVFENLPSDFNTLDLMQSVPELYVQHGTSVSHNFFHLTLQEYLAAVKISKLPVKEQIDFFEGNSGSYGVAGMRVVSGECFNVDPQMTTSRQRMKMDLPPPHRITSLRTELDDTTSTRFQKVLRFVAGLTKYDNIPLDSMQQLLLQHDREDVIKISLNSLHWLFEARCINIYNDLIRNVSILQYISDHSMTPFDCFVLGYALSHISCTGDWEIGMNKCHIDDECVEMLVGGINFMPSKKVKHFTIAKLYLCDNAITAGGATTLAEMLKGNGILQQLNIRDNSIGQGGATALAQMLKEDRTLQQLDISKNSMGQGGVTILAEMLKENRTLQQLDISENSMCRGGATALAEMLKENRTLQQLNIRNNSIGQEGATALAEMLKENSTLQQLNIRNNSIGQLGATALAETLKENRTLQQLNVRYNSIGLGGATKLAEMLKENRTLQQLDISDNSIGLGGATALAESLKENRTLQQLNISENSIGQGGATALADMLKENRTLQQLDVSYNSIGQGGATALAKMLRENRTLQQLNVCYNSIGQGGTIILAEMLKKNRSLQQLDIRTNSIGQGGAIALVEMLKENRSLQQLDVRNNSISQGGATTCALTELQKENTICQVLISN